MLENQHIEAQVLHGKDIHDDIIPIRKCRVELVIAIQKLCEAYSSPLEDRRATPEEREARDQKIYHTESSSPHGAFTKEIESALDKYEKKFRKLIGTRG